MSKPPPDLGEDSARLYESPGQKTEEMAVQLFRVHYTSGERARVKQRLSPPRFAVARPERERRSASKTNFQLSRPSGRWFVGLRYAVRTKPPARRTLRVSQVETFRLRWRSVWVTRRSL